MISIVPTVGIASLTSARLFRFLSGKGGTYNNGIDVDAVDNDAHCETFVSKGHANDAGLSGGHCGHCIEEVRDPLSPSSTAAIKVPAVASL